jgi:hypothetical protein
VVRLLALAAAISVAAAARPVAWPELTPAVQARLTDAGMTSATFDAKLAAIDGDGRRRVQEGDEDHLIFYILQSTHFTALPPIEPALSARAYVTAAQARPPAAPPQDVDARLTAFLAVIDSKDADPRLNVFRAMLSRMPAGAARRQFIGAAYARAMPLLYQKEFGAARGPGETERLYEQRGLSTDTEVEAGYAVQAGLGVLKGLDSSRRVRRVLIVGPGIDLAPRTGMLESGPPESYQPWAVIDALVGLGLSKLDDLEVVGADINPRVVERLRQTMETPPMLRLVSGIGESGVVTCAPGFREYFAALGGSVGRPGNASGRFPAGHMAKTVTVSGAAARTLRAEPLNIVTERLAGEPFDLAIATNILPYFGPVERLLALSNVAAMLAPGGVFLQNDARPEVLEAAAAAGLVAEQSREVIIATVKGAPPLADTIVLHRRR